MDSHILHVLKAEDILWQPSATDWKWKLPVMGWKPEEKNLNREVSTQETAANQRQKHSQQDTELYSALQWEMRFRVPLLQKYKEGPTFFEGAIRCVEQFRLEQKSASSKNPFHCAQSLSEQAGDLHLPVHPETCLARNLHRGARAPLTTLPDPQAPYCLTCAPKQDRKDLT